MNVVCVLERVCVWPNNVAIVSILPFLSKFVGQHSGVQTKHTVQSQANELPVRKK